MLGLFLTAELVGVTNLSPVDTNDSPYYYTFKVVCTSCREEHANWVGVNRHEQNEMSGSRGEANFVWKCKNCKRESSASITDGPKAYEHQDPTKAQLIIKFDCRGCEFTDFKSDGEWNAKGIDSNTSFNDIDLSEGEWFDYDEKVGDEVSIRDVKWEIKRA